MTYDITPRSFFRFPLTWEEDDLIPNFSASNGLSISEDDTNVYVEAAVPGVDPKEVDITFDKGILWIKGETKKEEQGKKYYRKAAESFSYRVAVPSEIDYSQDPEATCEKGIMKVTFKKSPKSQPKKIAVKTAK